MLFTTLATILAAAVSCDKTPDENVLVHVTEINLNLPEIGEDGYVIVNKDGGINVSASVVPATATDTLKWSIDDGDVAYATTSADDPLQHNATITALKEGVSTVRVKAGEVEADFLIHVPHVNIPLESIVLNVDEITIPDNESVEIGYSIVPENADYPGISWTISDENVVEYSWDEDGIYYIDAVAPGTATVTASCGDVTASCTITVVSSYVPVTSITASDKTVNCYEQFEIPVTVMPSNATIRGCTFIVDDPSIVSFDGVVGSKGNFVAIGEGTTTIKAVSRDNEAGKSCTFEVTVKGPKVPLGAVDLGFRIDNQPIFFRTANLGSDAEIDAGFLYAWGDPTAYYYSKNPYTWRTGKEDGYTLANYKWYDAESDTYTKYTADTKRQLDPEDDPAHQALGGSWYTPTISELLELYNNCNREETIRSGIHGMLFTSRIEGYEAAELFLPAGGYLNGNENVADGNFESYWGKRWYMGCYQSSTLPFNDDSSRLTMESYEGDFEPKTVARFIGLSIRPVWRGVAE